MPRSEKRARRLLTPGKAVVDRMNPFTIRLKERVGGEVQPLRLFFPMPEGRGPRAHGFVMKLASNGR